MKQALLLSLLLMCCALAQPHPPRPAPRLNLLEPCRGRVTVAAFIVTGCAHCQAFTRRVMEPLYQSKQICAVAVAFDQDADTGRFSNDQGLTFPVYKLERKVVREFLGLTGPDRTLGTPQVVVIDKAGMIRAQSAAAGSPLLLQPAVIREIVERLK
jgi:hypothetical protein